MTECEVKVEALKGCGFRSALSGNMRDNPLSIALSPPPFFLRKGIISHRHPDQPQNPA